MPMIKVKYDNNKLKKSEVVLLSDAVQKIVSEVTGIADVFVYADASEINIKIAPIEIFVEMSAWKIKDKDKLTADIVAKIKDWKKDSSFTHPINFTLIPMEWKVEIAI